MYYTHFKKKLRLFRCNKEPKVEESALVTIWHRPYCTEFFLKCEKFQTKVGNKIKTHILHSITFFPKKALSFKRESGKASHSCGGGECVLRAEHLWLQKHARNK